MKISKTSLFVCFAFLSLHRESPGQHVEKVFDFSIAANSSIDGEFPNTALEMGGNGSLYGTATTGDGTIIYRITATGNVEKVVTIPKGGGNPERCGGLLWGGDGYFYFVTQWGGTNNLGCICRMDLKGTVSTLVSFTGNLGSSHGGSYPVGKLMIASDGLLYGMTQNGGESDNGTIFRVSRSGSFFETLVHFSGIGGATKGSFRPIHQSANGANTPNSSLIEGPDRAIYGTTLLGGESNHGTIFRLRPGVDFTTLVEFTGASGSAKGREPYAAMVAGTDGFLYGTTYYGGSNDYGTVFKFSTSGTLTTLYEFASERYPASELIWGSDGFLYGATRGGEYAVGSDIFKFKPADGISFLNFPVKLPSSALYQYTDGSFYGVSSRGGAIDLGFAFKFNSDGEFTKLFDFRGGKEGRVPNSHLVEDNEGNFYGTTFRGGDFGHGTIYRIRPDETFEFYDSPVKSARTENPSIGLILDSNGDFFGASAYPGGVFKWNPQKNPGGLSLFEFEGSGMGNPWGVSLTSEGSLIGVAESGGNFGPGFVYNVSQSGDLIFKTPFDGTTGGKWPRSTLVKAMDGLWYGTTVAGGQHDLGTIFSATENGTLTARISFTGNSGAHLGASPGGLLAASNGKLYGMTGMVPGGGLVTHGTVYEFDPATAEFRTLVVLTDNGATNKGSNGQDINNMTAIALVEASDGNLYGVTLYGGSAGKGTLFRVTTSGAMTTLYEFPGGGLGLPRTALMQASDGNLYGTTSEGDGAVYRLVLPGKPSLVPLPEKVLPGSVSFSVKSNPRGNLTTVSLEYGTQPGSWAPPVVLAYSTVGYSTRFLGTRLASLLPGTTYYYRFIAESAAGKSISSIRSFSTLAPPVVESLSALPVGRTDATLHGLVNAKGFDSRVSFEWGSDGKIFPHSVHATPSLVNGSISLPVSVSIGGLNKGTPYFFRVVATNAGGSSASGTVSFRTLTEPVLQIGRSFAVNSTSVRVEGTIDPEGSMAEVFFEYGIDGLNFPNRLSAVQGPQGGLGIRSVSALLENLQQGVTYHYRLRAGSTEAGYGLSEVNAFSMNVISGFDRVAPHALPAADGFLLVNLSPSRLLHGWRFIGEARWRTSGVPAVGLVPGDRLVEFRPVAGHSAPPTELVSVRGGGAATIHERSYFKTEPVDPGGLTVNLKPDSITTGGEGRAQWALQVPGKSEVWRDSGSVITDLPAGDYLVVCKKVSGRTTPFETKVAVSAGQTASLTMTYFEAATFPGEEPSALAFETVSQEPYAYLGQVRGTAGSGTGFVVKERVVATAAHVVWDDGSRSASQDVQWLHQRHAGVHESKPIEPRGFYLLSGYAAGRAGEETGSFSPESRNLDVAALYFRDPSPSPARDGYGGYLASDLANNEFLLSRTNKMLAGYPVDGISPASQGRMHATKPFDESFAPVGARAPRVFLTKAVRSSGGASGGPVLVQFEAGAYYPAAVYLGGGSESVVRAIDSDVVLLFNAAAHSAISDEPFASTGATRTTISEQEGAGYRGSLNVIIEPAAARAAGARWRLKAEGEEPRPSGKPYEGLQPNRYILELLPAPGYVTPSSKEVSVVRDKLITEVVDYVPVPGSPGLRVTGSSWDIYNGDIAPSMLDGSDFGIADIGIADIDKGTTERTFTISNPGNASLSLSSVQMGGSHADDFSVLDQPDDTVLSGGSTTFKIRFDPSAAGTRSATVSFFTNVAGSNPFSFNVQGNNTDDKDRNGFTDLEESDLAELLASFTVGQSVDLDLSFLRLAGGQTSAILGLPPGLSFGDNRITGTITGKANPPQITIEKRDGTTLVSLITRQFPVFTEASTSLTPLQPFPRTRVGDRSKPATVTVTNAGELPLTGLSAVITGRSASDFQLTPPRISSLGANASTTFKVTFRPRTKGRHSASVTVRSNVAPRTIPVSGTGK